MLCSRWLLNQCTHASERGSDTPRRPQPGADEPTRLRQAIWHYNHDHDYVDLVLATAARYATPLLPAGNDPQLLAAALNHPRLTIYAAGRDDIAHGRIDPRILTLLVHLAERWPITVTSLRTGHSRCIGGGNTPGCHESHHWHGRGADIAIINGEPITSANTAARDLTIHLDTLSGPLRPDEVGSPWPDLSHRPGHFSDTAHADHIHVGYAARPGAATAPQFAG